MLEGRGGPTGTAVLLRLHRAPPSPRGPQSRRWGGRLAGTCHPAHVGTAGLLPGFLSVRRDFRPGLSSASRESGVTNLPESSGRRGMVPEIYPGQMQPGHYCTSFITMNCCTNGVLVTRSPRLGSGFDISLPPCPELLIGMISPIPASLSSVR
jgi:hypothetical protein